MEVGADQRNSPLRFGKWIGNLCTIRAGVKELNRSTGIKNTPRPEHHAGGIGTVTSGQHSPSARTTAGVESGLRRCTVR